MSGFPVGLVVSLVITTILLFLAGWFLWHKMFNHSTDFSSSEHYPDAPPPDVEREESATGLAAEQPLQPKTVSAADTISNHSDEAVVELKERTISTQKTVEAAGDVSVTMDEED